MSTKKISRQLIALAVAASIGSAYSATKTAPVTGTLNNWKSWNASSKTANATPLAYANARDGIDLFQGLAAEQPVPYTIVPSPSYLSMQVTGQVTYDDVTGVISALTLQQGNSISGYYDVTADAITDGDVTTGQGTSAVTIVDSGKVTISGLSWVLDPVNNYLSQVNGTGTATGCNSGAAQCSFTVKGTNLNDHSNGLNQSIFDFQGINDGFQTLPQSNAKQTAYGPNNKSWPATPGVTGTINPATGAITLTVASRVDSGSTGTNAANTATFSLTAALASDTDGDGVNDDADNCPADKNANQLDTDGDKIGNVCDINDDGDNWSDNEEAVCGTDPLNASDQCLDTDGDGISNTEDSDDDGDTNSDAFETACGSDPLNAASTCFNLDTDTDGTPNLSDNCPNLSNPDQLNSDNDPQGNACDDNDDNDADTDAQEAICGSNPLSAASTCANLDSDGDGKPNVSDNCPNVANADQANADVDAQGNACDSDDDNDTVPDGSDAFPLDPTESVDTDGDGKGNNGDNCPNDSNADQLNTDGDSQGNVCDANDDNDADTDAQEAACGSNPLSDASTCANLDSDGDTVPNVTDNCPNTANTNQLNTDGAADGGDACDTDDDNDTKLDGADNCPLISNANQLNTDDDSQGNVCDSDDDNDGVVDISDAFPLDSSESVDTDGDGKGNNSDNCPSVSNADQANSDGDAQGNACDLNDDNDANTDAEEVACGSDPLNASSVCAVAPVDTDNDGVPDSSDNCPTVSNADQANNDGDSEGNACDATPNGPDQDGDGIPDATDNCPAVSNADQANTDGDSQGNACDATPNGPDQDGDGVPDSSDNCPAVSNADQANSDGDSQGNACDATPNGDADSDGVDDATDNCPAVSNADQLNSDDDAQGNACDNDDDNDGVADGSDKFPLDKTESVDTDNDGTGNNKDLNDDGDAFSDIKEINFCHSDPLDPNSGCSTKNCGPTTNICPMDTDGDKIPDWQDADDDNDGQSDVEESGCGSNPLDANDKCVYLDDIINQPTALPPVEEQSNEAVPPPADAKSVPASEIAAVALDKEKLRKQYEALKAKAKKLKAQADKAKNAKAKKGYLKKRQQVVKQMKTLAAKLKA